MGCRDSSFGDCLVACTTASGCPRGLQCGTEGYCRLGDSSASCTLVLGDASPDTRPGMVDAAPDAPPPQIIGNATEFTTSSNHAANYLLGFQITVPTSRTLLRFGVIAKQATPNEKRRFVAHNDPG